MRKKNFLASRLAIISGIILIITGTSGLATWNKIQNFITSHIISNDIIKIIFFFFTIFASFGGLTVIIGGSMLTGKNPSFGKLLIWLGSGAGIIGLIISIFIGLFTKNADFIFSFSFVTIGVLLAITSQIIAKK